MRQILERQLSDRELFDRAMSQCGFGCDRPRKKVRVFEIVTGLAVGIGAIVLMSLIWTRWAN